MSAPEISAPFARETPRWLVAALSPPELRVALMVATFADDAGRCWPGPTTIARELGLEVTEKGGAAGYVRRILAGLIDRGVIAVAGTHRSGTRVLICTWLTGADVVHSPRSTGAGTRAPQARGARLTGAATRAPQAREQNQEQDHELPTAAGRELARAAVAAAARLAGRQTPPIADPEQIAARWAALRWQYRDKADTVQRVDVDALVRGGLVSALPSAARNGTRPVCDRGEGGSDAQTAV